MYDIIVVNGDDWTDFEVYEDVPLVIEEEPANPIMEVE